MKKLFTILAAALFSVSMMAETDVLDQNGVSKNTDMAKTSVTLPGTYINGQGGGNIAGYTPNNKGIKLKVKTTTFKISGTNYGYVVLNVNSGYIVKGVKLEGTSNAKGESEVVLSGVYADVNIEDLATVIPEATNHLASTTTFPNNETDYVSTSDLTFDATTNVVFVFDYSGSNSEMRAIITATYEEIPATNPVTEVTIAGPEACYTGKSITLEATTDVKATEIEWQDENEQTLGYGETYTFYPDVDGTYTFYALASNEYNDKPVKSTAHIVVVTTKTVLTELVPVDGDITWDFNGATTAQVDGNKQDTVIFYNLDAEWADGFAADKLAGTAEFFYRGDKYQAFQGSVLKFVTTVPGKVKVSYSNTGDKRAYRYVRVNKVQSATGSANGTKIDSEEFAVNAGEVNIDFNIPDPADPQQKEGEVAGLTQCRVYKVVFTKSGDPTAVENAEAAVKAVKVVENGQLVIIKNGVKYNAQGAIVK